MRRSTAKILLVILNILVLIGTIVVFAITNGNKTVLLIFFLVVIVLDLFLSRYLRCPSCGRGQGRNWLFAEFCPYCGTCLDDETP